MIEKRKPVSISRVNFIWYPVTLVPLVALLAASFAGYLPSIVGLLVLFLMFFWLSSLGFAIYATTRKRKEPRQ